MGDSWKKTYSISVTTSPSGEHTHGLFMYVPGLHRSHQQLSDRWNLVSPLHTIHSPFCWKIKHTFHRMKFKCWRQTFILLQWSNELNLINLWIKLFFSSSYILILIFIYHPVKVQLRLSQSLIKSVTLLTELILNLFSNLNS